MMLVSPTSKIVIIFLSIISIADICDANTVVKISLKNLLAAAKKSQRFRPKIVSCCGKFKCSKSFLENKTSLVDKVRSSNFTKSDGKVSRIKTDSTSNSNKYGTRATNNKGTSSDIETYSTRKSLNDPPGTTDPNLSQLTTEVNEDLSTSTILNSELSSVNNQENNQGATLQPSTGLFDSTINTSGNNSEANASTTTALTPENASLSSKNNNQDSTASITIIQISSNSTNSTSNLAPSTSSNASTISTENTTKTSTTTTTTTTTIPSLCKDPCMTYENATKHMNHTMLYPKGKYLMMASKMVFVDVQLRSLNEAVHACLKLNMALLSAESAAELIPLGTALHTNFNKVLEFWTSGANEGEYCEVEKVYSWCSVAKRVFKPEIEVKWAADANHEFASNNSCLSLKLRDSELALQYADCGKSKLSTICEPKCNSPTCPATCNADSSLFGTDNNLKDPGSHGFWAKNICGSTYLFSNTLGTWEQNFQKCCALGLQPIAFETIQELQCLSNFTNSSWTYNFNYWTGGTQKDCKGQWRWCSGTDALHLPDKLTWTFNQPDNKNGADDCLHMRLFQNKTGIALSDRNCSDKFIIACEGAPKIGNCLKPTCPNITHKRNESLFDGDTLKNFFSYGKWVNGCGRTILFSSSNATWEDANKACAVIGTNLIAVEYDEKDVCLTKLFLRTRQAKTKEFWTSGTDAECEGKFSWCAGWNRKFTNRKMTWSQEEDGDCVSVQFSNSSTYKKTNCEKKLQYICEIRNIGTHGRALQNECMEVWNISIADMLTFDDKYNSTSIPRNLKCFVKCVGENLELFSHGGFTPTAKMLRMIEDICGEDDEKLQANFQAYDNCDRKRLADECDTAAEMYQCGRETLPTVTSSLYSQLLGNNTIYKPPTPCIGTKWRKCKMDDLPCLPNATLKQTLSDTQKTPEGQYVTTSNGGKYFVSIKFGTSLPWKFSHDYCCSIGMYLAEIPDYQTFKDLQPIPFNYGTADGHADETYANGDGTDSWCKSNNLVNTDLYRGPYTRPECDRVSCFIVSVYDADRPYLQFHQHSSEADVGRCSAVSSAGERMHYFICS